MKKTAYIITLLLLVAGCAAKRDYAYLKDAPRDEEIPISNQQEQEIKKGDNLYIYVYSQLPETVRPFNQETNTLVSNKKPMGYTVDEYGDIIFPVIGRIHAAGFTPEAFARNLEGRLVEGRYVSDALVTLKITNYTVTVVGEVKKPMEITCTDNRLSIFDALAMCGDITMYDLRDNVKIIRTVDDKIIVDSVDLTKATLLESPYYYLQQGDIVYVEPTPKRKREAYRNEDWPRYVTLGADGLRLAYLLVYRFIINPRTSLINNN